MITKTKKKARDINILWKKKVYVVKLKQGTCPELATLAHTIISDYFKIKMAKPKSELTLQNSFFRMDESGMKYHKLKRT
jgi:hypothetical protein